MAVPDWPDHCAVLPMTGPAHRSLVANRSDIAIHVMRAAVELGIRAIAVSEPHDDATRTVFLELNRQPRSVRVAAKAQVASAPLQRKADPDNAPQLGAWVPGVAITVARIWRCSSGRACRATRRTCCPSWPKAPPGAPYGRTRVPARGPAR